MENKEIMKSKYLSRKFITSVAGLVVSVVAVVNDNTAVAIAGILLAGCFVIGESIIDAVASVKRSIAVYDQKSPAMGETTKEE